MSLAEGTSARVSMKAYASGVISPNAEAVSSSDLGASGAQILRRVSSSLKLGKDTYQSNEIRSDEQIGDFRHGTRRVTGSVVAGEFSPKTYGDLFEASVRGTWEAAVSASDSDLTSISASSVTSKFTFGGGNPVTLGFRVGHIVRFTGLATTANNATNFLILGFSGSNNRVVEVYPAPTTMSANSPDAPFSMASAGKRLYVPSSGFVNRKFGFEIYNSDSEMARLFTECRVGGFNMQLPASGLATIDFPVMGRNMEIYENTASPFFTSPTAETTTGIFAAVNGLLRVNGSVQGVVTGLTIQLNRNPSGDPVVGQDVVPQVFLGRNNVTGQMTAFLENADLINNFLDEDEIEILAYLTTTNDPNSPACSIYLPRVKFGDADVATSGEAGQGITMPFQALKSNTTVATAGIENTTLQLCDTEIA
jgi:hypothetical protein